MNRLLVLAILIVGILISEALLTPATAFADIFTEVENASLSATELNRLLKGEVLVSEPASPSSGTRFVLAKILIDRPLETVWNTLYNQERLFKDEPHMRKVKILSSPSPNQQKVAYSLNISRLLPTFDYVTSVNFIPTERTVKFDRLSGSFRSFKGMAKLKPVENGRRTILFYALQVDPGFLIPQMVVRNVLRSELPGMLTHIKRNVHSVSPVLTGQ